MLKEMKYIIVRMDCPWNHELDKKEVAIVFPKCLTHKHVARVHKVGEQVIVSAGFCELGYMRVTDADAYHDYDQHHYVDPKAYGHSESLELGSREEDAKIIDESYA